MANSKELSRDPVRFNSVDALRAIGGTLVMAALAGRSKSLSTTALHSIQFAVGGGMRNVQNGSAVVRMV